jgi:hypothetical protein
MASKKPPKNTKMSSHFKGEMMLIGVSDISCFDLKKKSAQPFSVERSQYAVFFFRQSTIGSVRAERATRLELVISAWEARVLPLHYARSFCFGATDINTGWIRQSIAFL